MVQTNLKSSTKKKSNILSIAIVCIILLVAIVAAVAIISNYNRSNDVSGLYYDDSGNYLKFNEGNKVTVVLSEIGTGVSGSYMLNGNQITVEYAPFFLGYADPITMSGTVSDDRLTITFDQYVFKKV